MMTQEVIHHTGILMTLEEGSQASDAFEGAGMTLREAVSAFEVIEIAMLEGYFSDTQLAAVASLLTDGLRARRERFEPILDKMGDRLRDNLARDIKGAQEFDREEAARKAQEGKTNAA
ncbi:hypothetical protein ACVDG3_15950 [Meridianimarinicoccus sp. RP-17]|uniref:hypothetical protein n=1 Tax=Meridianimarinicoccus zhengii TaxID=2056810 RepID=UPI000DAF0A16|nr:hypothetical protein [Phycocomes zhengii]